MTLNVAGEAADKVVEIALETITVVAKLSGKGVKEAIYIMRDISQDKLKNATGKASLEKMMKVCDNVEIFTLKQKDLERFMKEAEKYGVLYCTILDTQNDDPENVVDLFVRGEDANKVNRIVDRYRIEVEDVANLRPQEIKGKEEMELPVAEQENTQIPQEEKKNNVDNSLINSLIGEEESPIKELSEKEFNERLENGVSNDFLLEDNLSENSLEIKKGNIVNIETLKAKESVKLRLKECEKIAKNHNEKTNEEIPVNKKKNKNKNKKKVKGDKKNGKVK